ncbi:hypothetical protein CVT25_013379 [Psilocybe cyanescens]|uniref:Uncharacterized protein n=1 Tax=Psilocybe cyanescens TaxID=93625 RepID=A0A409VTB0_PSICY|nr:hypothetical protein CVT25_013379 [Psilocybe cyanescens]
MPASDVGNTGHPYPTYDRSHGDSDKGPRPQQRSSTRISTHRSHSQGPRDDERRVRDFVDRGEDLRRSRPSRTDNVQPLESFHASAHRTSDRDRDAETKDAGRPGERMQRPRAISVSSGNSSEYVQVYHDRKDANSSSRRGRDEAKPSTLTRDESGLDTGAHHRSAPAPAPTTRTYASAVRPTLPPGLNAEMKTSTRPSGADSPTKASHLPRNPAENRPSELAAHEKERLANAYPPMNPSHRPPTGGHIDSRAQAQMPAENVQQLDPSTAASNAAPGQLPGLFTHDASQPSQPQQSRPPPPPPPHVQQGDMREMQGSSPEKGFLRSAITSVWPSNTGNAPPRDKMKEELARLQTECNSYREDCKRMEKEYRAVRRTYAELEHERNRLRDNNHSLQHELTGVQLALDEAKALSDIRGKELVGAQVFLTKADALSISDVSDKVNVLNEEIFQVSAFFAEGIFVVAHGGKKQELSEEAMARVYDDTVKAIGGVLTDILNTQAQVPDSQVHPLVAQAMLSCFLVHFCILKLGSWYPSDANIDQFLGTVYSQIRQNEEQAVFGRWRSLLRAQIRPSTENWKTELTADLQNILNFASWDAPPDTKKSFAQKLTPIIKALEDLRIAIYEKYTSADLEAFSIGPGGPFETWMEDAYGDERQAADNGRGSAGKIVAGTTGIGLKKLKASPRGHRSAPETFESVLSPKVILESTLREALEPPPPTKGRKRRAPQEEGGGR